MRECARALLGGIEGYRALIGGDCEQRGRVGA